MAAKKKITEKAPAPVFSTEPLPTLRVGENTDVRIGMSGWTYAPWRGEFYPKGLKQKDELSYASRMVNSVEVNGTFYALQKPAVFEGWYASAPENFMFSVKAPQYLTHVRRLKDFEGPLAYFLASGVLHLKEKLGAILWQFPPFLSLKDDRFELFLEELPKTVFAAREFVEKHREAKKVRYDINVTEDAPLHHAFEMRHASFADKGFVELLRAHNVALVTGDSSDKWPYMEDQTADFRYLRLHGNEEFYPEGYAKKDVVAWSKRVQTWCHGNEPTDAKCVVLGAGVTAPKRIYLYFDNDHKIAAPFNALELTHALKKRD